MNSRNTIHEELKALDSGLSSGLNGEVYAVPEGYFEGLAAAVLSKVKAAHTASAREEIGQLSPLLAGLSRKMPYSVPDQYFHESGEVLNAITADEESLVLSFISKEMPYEVPLGYFANLPEQVMEKLRREQTRVVPLFRRKWMRVAAAAVLTGLVALSGILYFNRDGSADPVNRQQNVAVELEKVSTEELKNFLNTTDVNTVTASTPGSKAEPAQKGADEKEPLFDDVSDKELEAFLENIPTDVLPDTDNDIEVLFN